MEKRRLYEPGDMVSALTGEVGMVISPEMLAEIRDRFKEGRRPGRFFAPGCCSHPDYISQIPVLFQDGTFDVMRAMGIKRRLEGSQEEKRKIEGMMRPQGVPGERE